MHRRGDQPANHDPLDVFIQDVFGHRRAPFLPARQQLQDTILGGGLPLDRQRPPQRRHLAKYDSRCTARPARVVVRAGSSNSRTHAQTTTGPGGLIDKGTKGKRARTVPLIEEIRPLIERRLDSASTPDARLFTGPRGGRISTAVLRDATHWDDVVCKLGYEHLRRHDLRHTGLTWMADAGVPVHVLRVIAGHGNLTTTQRYLHPDRRRFDEAGAALSLFLTGPRSPSGPQRSTDDQLESVAA